MEIWKTINNWENIYEVSTSGNVRSLDRFTSNRKLKGINLKPKLDRYGYYILNLRNLKISKYIPIHRLVAITFIPNPENKLQVNHINGIKTDNRVENLEWVTGSENQKHAVKLGLKTGIVGEYNNFTKLDTQIVKDIRELYSKGYKVSELSKISKIPYSTIRHICLKESWKHLK